MKRQTASKAVPVWARPRAQVPHPQHSAAHRHTRREHPDVATPTSHLHCHTRTHSGVHRLRTSHQRLFYVKGSNQTTRQDLRAISSSQSCPHRSLGARASGGLPGENTASPPPKPCSTEEPQTDTEEPGQQDHHDRSVHTHSGKGRPAGSRIGPITLSQMLTHRPAQPGTPPLAAGTPPATPRHITGGTPGLKAQTAEKVPRQGLPCTAKCTRISERHKKPGQRKRLSLDPI